MNKYKFVPLLCLLVLDSKSIYAGDKNNFNLSLEKLSRISLDSPATLTSLSEKDIPSSITTISHQQIQETSARSLDELLEFHVPGYQRHAQAFNTYQVSNRGFVGNGQFLLLVNGKRMSEHSQHSSIMERDLTALGDIDEIKVIRGSAAAIYGHGALNMVISIKTMNSRTFEGTKMKFSAGVTEEFLNGELSFGYKWKADQGVYLFAGLTDYQGAKLENSPVFFGVSGTKFQGRAISATNTTGYAISNDYQNAGDKLAIKLHGQLDIGDFSVWARYTRGGKRFATRIDSYEQLNSSITQQYEVAYEQATINLDYKKFFNKHWMTDFSVGYDMTEGLRRQGSTFLNDSFDETYREDQILAKLLIRNEQFEHQSFAMGAEFSYERFGLEPFRVSDAPVRYASFFLRFSEIDQGKRIEPWSAITVSGLFEHQWKVTDSVSFLTNLRIDARDHIELMYSPRFGVTYDLGSNDTFNFIISRSNKIPDAPLIRKQTIQGGDEFTPTTNDTVELKWNRNWERNISTLFSIYGQQREFTDWNSTKLQETQIGIARQWGLEFELSYHGEKLDISLSHQFNKLIDLKLNDPDTISIVSSQPNGFGDDLNILHNNISKLNIRYQFTRQLSGLITYVRYWGSPGSAGFHDFTNDRFAGGNSNNPSVRAIDNIDPYAFSESADYLQASINWNILKNTKIGIHGNYLLGFIDDNYNKRGFSHNGYYRTHAPAFNFQLSHKF